MPRYLVVANQTLGGEELKAEIRDRMSHADAEFHVLVPVTPMDEYRNSAGAGTSTFAGSGDVTAAHDEARKQARHRMMALVGEIRDEGGVADGELGVADPLEAIQRATAGRVYDEILLSTFPQGISKWLKLDLPSRVERSFGGPVKAIISEG